MGKQESNQNSYEGSIFKKDQPEIEPLWTVEDVSQYLRLEPGTVRTMARDGKLPGIKIGRVWRFNHKDIYLWLKKETSSY